MRNFIFAIFGIAFLALFAFNANAQMPAPYGTEGSRSGMGRFSTDSSIGWEDVVKQTISEENEGKELWNKFQAKEIACADILDMQFEALGEYFMGQMMGDSHTAMNAMMIQMHGKDGENQIHTVLGKRISGCDTSATFPTGDTSSWMPMMQMMLGGYSSPFGFSFADNMMSSGYGLGFLGWIFMILWWVLIIAGIVAVIKWLINQFQGGPPAGGGKSALGILKERYAKGEIDKKEFEEKKQNLS